MKTFLTSRSAQSAAVGTAAATKHSFRAALLGLAVLGSAALSTPAQAQQAAPVHTKADTESLWLTIDNPSYQRVQVKVVQQTTNACLSNVINHQFSYGTKLDFSKLPAGDYAVVLRVGHERFRYAVQVQAQAQHSTISVRELNSPVADKAVATAAL